MFDRKIFFRDLCVCGGGQDNAPLPPPTPMVGPQAPHQLNPALELSLDSRFFRLPGRCRPDRLHDRSPLIVNSVAETTSSLINEVQQNI